VEMQQLEHPGIDPFPDGRTLLHLDRKAQLRLTPVDRIAVAMQCHLIFSPTIPACDRRGCFED
jgi:hypothetical protein